MAADYEHKTVMQSDINWGESFKMAVKAPAIADRIFRTYDNANAYIHDNYNSAIAGLVLTVIDDGERNGVYFVDSVTHDGQGELVLVKLSLPTEMPYATEEEPGVIQLATLQEAIEGENTNKAITPSTLRAVTNFVFTQASISNTWNIQHNLNKYPSVTVVDSGNTVWYGEVKYIDLNNIQIKFNQSISGKAYLN